MTGVLAVFSGCTPLPEVSQIRVILKPTQELYLLTSNLADCVNEAAGATLIVLGVGVNAIPVLYEDHPNKNVCGTWTRECSRTGKIKLDRECRTDLVLLHEIGHAMGLEHNEHDFDDIMFPHSLQMTREEACYSLAKYF